jgi:hypothetical protein
VAAAGWSLLFEAGAPALLAIDLGLFGWNHFHVPVSAIGVKSDILVA